VEAAAAPGAGATGEAGGAVVTEAPAGAAGEVTRAAPAAAGGPAREEEAEFVGIVDASAADVETLAGETCETAVSLNCVGRLITHRHVGERR